MPKNILIFSDGTVMAGGLLPDEVRSNVYKLFRATRCGPDSNVDPSRQIAFYDPGLGSKRDGGGFKFKWWRRIYDFLSLATGLGITQNIIDCYAAIIRLYEPGDRIYLFGFSRGAYTVRCVGAVLKYCGVPTRMADGSPLKRDPASTHALATHAVRNIYQFGSSMEDDPFCKNRYELARRFREQHASGTPEHANAAPYFIGVWDTVAALGISWSRLFGLTLGVIAAVSVLAWGISFVLSHTVLGMLFPAALFWRSFWWLTSSLVLIGVAAYLYTHLKFATGLSRPWYRTLHITGWRMRFYDTELDPAVRFARHALAIDENRRDFAHVPWTNQPVDQRRSGQDNGVIGFKQVWFPGMHADVGGGYIDFGGGYSENESRLSDIALAWMVEEAQSTPDPILVDRTVLRLWPSSSGPQHDERKRAPAEQIPRWIVWLLSRFLPANKITWPEKVRKIPADAPLHPTVIERFALPAVLQYDETAPYRPESLRHHRAVSHYYV